MAKEEMKEKKGNTLRFGEGSDVLIRQGFKLASTRLPELDRDFPRGESVDCICGPQGNVVTVVITDNTIRPLYEFSPPRLILGSFLSLEEATQKLGNFFQKDVKPNDPMRHLVFVEKEKFTTLPDEKRNLLLTLSTEEALREKQLREIFFPSIIHWLSVKTKGGPKEWTEFLNENKLIDGSEASKLSALPSLPNDEKGFIGSLG